MQRPDFYSEQIPFIQTQIDKDNILTLGTAVLLSVTNIKSFDYSDLYVLQRQPNSSGTLRSQKMTEECKKRYMSNLVFLVHL